MFTAIATGLMLSATLATAKTDRSETDTNTIALSADQMAAVNDTPCGVHTIAVINTEGGDRYIFCGAKSGSFAIEVRANADASPGLLDRYDDPVALLAAVLPANEMLPEPVMRAIERGEPLTSEKRSVDPWVVGTSLESFERASASKASCAAPALSTNGFDPWDEFFVNSVYCGLVHTQSASSNDTDWHQQFASNTTGTNEGSHQHAGPHYNYGDGILPYYADEDEDGGARFGRALVRSCSGTTRFRGWLKASPTTGSWGDPIAEYYVPQGSTYVMRLWANPQHSLWMGYDADDIRFRVDAVSGSSFGSRMYFAKYGWGTSCAINY
jgi:hypothetical protein